MDYTKMDNSVRIWEYLLPYLTNNTELKKLMNVDNILPLAMNENTPYPFIIFRRSSISVTYTKPIAGSFDNRVGIALDVYSNNYFQSVQILNLVRNILENLHFRNEEIIVHELQVVSITEQYTQDGFRQTINFDCWVE